MVRGGLAPRWAPYLRLPPDSRREPVRRARSPSTTSSSFARMDTSGSGRRTGTRRPSARMAMATSLRDRSVWPMGREAPSLRGGEAATVHDSSQACPARMADRRSWCGRRWSGVVRRGVWVARPRRPARRGRGGGAVGRGGAVGHGDGITADRPHLLPAVDFARHSGPGIRSTRQISPAHAIYPGLRRLDPTGRSRGARRRDGQGLTFNGRDGCLLAARQAGSPWSLR